MLKDPSGLFILKNDICFIVGLLLPFSIFSFIILIKTGLTLTGLLTGTSQVISQDFLFTFVTVSASIILFIVICFIPFFVTSYLISSSVGLQIQRNELAKISSAGVIRFGLKEILSAAFVITCGMAAGCILLPYFSVLNILLEISLLDFLKDKLPLIILSFAIAYIINFFWIFYLKFFTGKAYGRYISEDVPLKRYYIFNAASALLFSVMILPAAGTFFRVYSEKVKLLNDVTDYLLIALPFIYIIFFAATAAVCGISNSVNKTCSACGQSTPQGILIGKNCAKCGEVFSRWLYI